ncbi:MAG: hypothetical protein ACPGTP_01325 [Bacteroidia bacterium]
MKLDEKEYLESRGIRPTTVLTILIIVNILLGVIVAFFPNDGIDLGEAGSLKFVSLDGLLGTEDKVVKEVDLKDVLKGIEPVEPEVVIDSVLVVEPILVDTAVDVKKVETPKPLPVKSVPTYRRLQVPPNNPDALASLARGLRVESKEKVVRILHYGDSQLEGDRVTDYFRNKLQKTFGGKGAGIILPNEPVERRNVFISETENFKKDAVYVKGSKVENNNYGIGGTTISILGSHTSYMGLDTVVTIDTAGEEHLVIKKIYSDTIQTPSFVSLNMGYSGYRLSKQHTQVSLLYTNDERFETRIENDNLDKTYELASTNGLGVRTWNMSTKKNLRMSFPNGKFPKIYGIALDGQTGVAVDNFGMRGSSYFAFDKCNMVFANQQLNKMNVKAIILQYGVNVIPNVVESYSYYKRILVRQLKRIRETNPDICIIVIGPSDMSMNDEGEFVSYSNIPKIRNAMKDAAFETGCCFWDLYEAMGGENSMSAWVEQGLAKKDYTHFTFKGASYVGEMLYDALLEQLNKTEI